MDSLTTHYRALLGLDDSWTVADVDLSVAAKRVVISLEFIGGSAICPECGAACPLKDHAAERQWRHLDTMQFETVLKARVPRANCEAHGVRTVSVPWADPHSRFTLMFEAVAIEVLIAASSVNAAGDLLRISWESAHRIMERAVERGLAVRDVDGLRYVGLDEKSFGRGQNYISVMTDPDGSRVLEVAPGRTEDSAGQLWESLSPQQREQIEAVSIDMWQAFENSVREHAPQAEVVYDRFHIAKYLNEAVDQVRRQEHRQLRAEGDDRLTGTRQMWLFHPENLSESKNEKLDALRKQSLQTSRAWGLKDYFRWFWTSADADSAREFFEDWYAWAIRSRLEPVKKVARMLSSRLENILTWFRHPISNGPSEGFNSRIQSIKAAARGFRNFANYRTRILFFCAKLKLKPTRI